MKREDFEQLKEKEKAHLREVRRLKQRLREAERVRSIGKALGEVESAGSMDELDEAVKRVQLEALEGESRLDLALESNPDFSLGLDRKPDPAELEAELSKARAAELVRHMKISMGLADVDPKPDASSEASPVGSSTGKSVGRGHLSESKSHDRNADTAKASTEKTIGRMKHGDE